MFHCEQVQAQLIDRLYDLLEPEALAAFDAHIGSCATCSQALAKAREFQALVGKAAKSEFPEVRFTAPAPSQPAQPKVVARSRGALRRFTRFALAAALFLAVGAVTVPTASHVVRYVETSRELARLDAQRSALRAEAKQIEAEAVQKRQEVQVTLDRARQQVEDAEARWQAAREQVVKSLKDRRMYMLVTGPETVQAGAPNDYTIDTFNLHDQHVPAKLDICVSDKRTGRVLYEEKAVHTTGQYRVSLPIDLKFAPGTDITLDIRAKGEGFGMPQTELTDRLLIAAPVYMTHLATDRPLYQPGDTVYFRSLTLNRNTLQPANTDLALEYALHRADRQGNPIGPPLAQLSGTSKLEQATPKGRVVVRGPDGEPIRGIGTGALTLPVNAASGWYVLTVRELNNRFPMERRKVLVNAYTPDRLTKLLEFDRRSYGPGEQVIANLKVARAEGGILAHAKVNSTLIVDGGETIRLAPTVTDTQGQARVSFQLPHQIERGEVILSVQVQDQAGPETIVRPVPVVVKKLEVEFYPEGGDLVAGVPNRVYFQARTPLGRPAELRGRIVESDTPQRVVAHVETLNDPNEPGINQGQGIFTFTPKANTAYSLLIDSPTGFAAPVALPQVHSGGVVLSVPTGVTGEGEDLKVILHSPDKQRTLRVGAYARGRVLDDRRVNVPKGEAVEVRLRPNSTIGGVTRVTVFEEQQRDQHHRLVPVAERLIYRKSGQRLNLAIQADKTRYFPGDSVRLTLSATDEQGQAAPAVAMVGVVNHSTISMADEKTFRTMPTHFLLTSEVRRPEDLEYADFLLSDHPKAPQALDLLLGTQGWRRFAEQDPRHFQQRNDVREAEALLVRIGRQKDAHLVDSQDREELEKELTRIDEQHSITYNEAVERQERLEEQLAALAKDPELTDRREQLTQQSRELELARVQAAQVLAGLEATNARIRMMLYPVVMLVSLAVIVWCLVRAAQRQLSQAVPYYALASSTATLCVLLVGYSLFYQPNPSTLETAQRWDRTHGLASPAPAIVQPPAAPAQAIPDQAALADQPGKMPGGGDDQKVDVFAKGNHLRRGLLDAEQEKGPGQPAPPPADPAQVAGGKQVEKEAADLADKKIDLNLRSEFDGSKVAVVQADRSDYDEGHRDLQRKRGLVKLEREQLLAENKQPLNGRLNSLRPPSFLQQITERQRALTVTVRPQAPGGPVPNALDATPVKVQTLPEVPPAIGGDATAKADAPLNKFGLASGFGALDNRNAQLRQATNLPPLVVREYAHRVEPNRQLRDDFTETVLWQPVVIIPQQGAVDVSFDLSDSISRYEILVAAHTLDGRLGTLRHEIEARKAFSLDPRIPLEVTTNDRLDVPLTIVNDTAIERSVQLVASPNGLVLTKGNPQRQRLLAPAQRAREIFSLEPGKGVLGRVSLRFDGLSEPFAPDAVERRLTVVPEGFPVAKANSGRLNGFAQTKLVLPHEWVPGTLRLRVQVYPTTLAELQQGLDGLLQEPTGCFEQTSTTNYPNVLILNYLKTHDRADPALMARARGLLERGYHKLISFECQDLPKASKRGFEWFGGTAPPHEALTAYGLMQFRDMAKVYPVDPALLARTHQYLLDCRDGQGGFTRNPRALDSFGQAPAHITDAYIIWAITESERDRAAGQHTDLSVEIAQLLKRTETSKDPYLLALAANALLNLDQTKQAAALLDRLSHLQQQDGYLDGSEQSITGSRGHYLRIETTALAALAWLKAKRPDDAVSIRQAVQWLTQQRGPSGAFGSTQATILALKAIIAYNDANRHTLEAGELLLQIGNECVARLKFDAGMTGTLTLELPAERAEQLLKPGANDVRVELVGGGKIALPYTLSWSYHLFRPENIAPAPVVLTTALDRQLVREGDVVRLKAVVKNVSGRDQGMTVAVLGLPAGLKVPEDMKQLTEWATLRDNGTKEGPISAFEIRGRELVLYWRGLKANQEVALDLSLIAHVPGRYRGPASRAYLYYGSELRHWVDPLTVEITPRDD